MTQRKIVTIDEDKCDGCGQCVTSCAEGALQVVDGKARLVSEVYCDGLGACLGECPQGAIKIEERAAPAFDAAKVKQHLARTPALVHAHGGHAHGAGGCPGSRAQVLPPRTGGRAADQRPVCASALLNWPVQLKLVNPAAPFLKDADLLLVADCVPFAYADFHQRFLRRRPVIIGCPKLDETELYLQKLVEILRSAQPRSLTVIRMEVPCCGGLTHLARQALATAQAAIPASEVIIGIQGEVLQEAAVAS